ncbi:hypothetical protein EHQ68_04610 [Leptospira congkakensis]|uniref:Uncharacterized protein n=1 Tax=Leptospira congkakensis TaxID=2484932 RepID=A0A4Z1ADI2_9LEPT|nr:hypothetical protein [Leptospira congkakensis]TGL90710.1 hypothetical protein EHQ69_12370 [Leptospira congkakensis]TGL91717.1 hypothetical protein EHQ68_04610 [Leptospira congkakensis]TGL98770.1 hypothetical protein EHQ70_04195 [Leptospira congkakensis]
MKNYSFIIFLYVSGVYFINCQPEYINSPEACLLIQADIQSLNAKDLADFNSGKITEQKYLELQRMREEGALGICLVSLIKRKQNRNF